MLDRKTCTCCKQEKDRDSFGKHKEKPDGLNYSCLECTRQRDALRYARDKEKRTKLANEYYQRTKENKREQRNLWYKNYMANNPDKRKTRLVWQGRRKINWNKNHRRRARKAGKRQENRGNLFFSPDKRIFAGQCFNY